MNPIYLLLVWFNIIFWYKYNPSNVCKKQYKQSDWLDLPFNYSSVIMHNRLWYNLIECDKSINYIWPPFVWSNLQITVNLYYPGPANSTCINVPLDHDEFIIYHIHFHFHLLIYILSHSSSFSIILTHNDYGFTSVSSDFPILLYCFNCFNSCQLSEIAFVYHFSLNFIVFELGPWLYLNCVKSLLMSSSIYGKLVLQPGFQPVWWFIHNLDWVLGLLYMVISVSVQNSKALAPFTGARFLPKLPQGTILTVPWH